MKTSLLTVGNLLLLLVTTAAQAQTPAAPLVVLSGADSAVAKGECFRVTTQEEWIALWTRHTANHPKMASGMPRQQPPTVDFTRGLAERAAKRPRHWQTFIGIIW